MDFIKKQLLILSLFCLGMIFLIAYFKGIHLNISGLSIKTSRVSPWVTVLVVTSILNIILSAQFQNRILFGISIFIAIIIIEVILRANPLVLGHGFANYALCKYHTGPDGIYYFDTSVKMQMMKPNFKCQNYMNGYSWTHQTDNQGFRNAQNLKKTDILLLGDSFIYGHGAELEDTVAYNLSIDTNLKVYNMARQGDSAFQHAFLFNKYGQFLQPKKVIYFYFINDLYDVENYLTAKEKKDYLNSAQGNIENQIAKRQLISKKKRIRIRYYLQKFFVVKAYLAMNYWMDKWVVGSSKNKLPFLDIEKKTFKKDYPESSLEWQFIKKVLLHLNSQCEDIGAQLILAPITLGHTQQFSILHRFAKMNKIPFIDTRQMDGKKEFYLPLDGHFSPRGAKEMSRIVSHFLGSFNSF